MLRSVSIVIFVSAILVGVGLYFTSFAPTCMYEYTVDGESKSGHCPDYIVIAGEAFDIHKICSTSPCLYSGSIGGDQNNASIQSFCHWANPAIGVFGIMSVACYLAIAIFGFVMWYKNKMIGRIAIILIALAGIIGLITAIMGFVDVGQHGCSNGNFQNVFSGRKTPGIHYGFASLELLMGLILIGGTVYFMPRRSMIEDKLMDVNIIGS